MNTGRGIRGGLPLVTFLGRARKVTSRRAAPGLQGDNTDLVSLKMAKIRKTVLSLLTAKKVDRALEVACPKKILKT